MNICTTVGPTASPTVFGIRPRTKPQPLLATGSNSTEKHMLINYILKDNASNTITLETLCTLDTKCSNHSDPDNVLINLTIWDRPIAQYQPRQIQPTT